MGEIPTIDPEEVSTNEPIVFDGLQEWLSWAITQRLFEDPDPSSVSILSGNISTDSSFLRRNLNGTPAGTIRLRHDHPWAAQNWVQTQQELARKRTERVRTALGATVGLYTTSTFASSPLTHEQNPLVVIQSPGIGIVTPTSDLPVASFAFPDTPSKRPAIAQVELTPGMVFNDYLRRQLAQLGARGFNLATARAHISSHVDAHPYWERYWREVIAKNPNYNDGRRNLGLSAAWQLREAGIGGIEYSSTDVRHDKTRFANYGPGVIGHTATAVCIRNT